MIDIRRLFKKSKDDELARYANIRDWVEQDPETLKFWLVFSLCIAILLAIVIGLAYAITNTVIAIMSIGM